MGVDSQYGQPKAKKKGIPLLRALPPQKNKKPILSASAKRKVTSRRGA
jgi:hypothetical protein